ncbi:RepA family replication protein [Candidatus Williamhamiltonella defendens]
MVELNEMGPKGLRNQVNIEYHYLRKVASTPPPDIPVH